MELAKPRIDIGLSTNTLEPMLSFWTGDAGVSFDHILPIRRGHNQHRHDANGSVVKINHHADALPTSAPSGYRELIIARSGLAMPCDLVDPDGNRVRLTPEGADGVTQIAVRLAVRSLDAHRGFYLDALGLIEELDAALRTRRSGRARASCSSTSVGERPLGRADGGSGRRYITFPGVQGRRRTRSRALRRGGREALGSDHSGQHRPHFDGARSRRQLDRAFPARLDRRLTNLSDPLQSSAGPSVRRAETAPPLWQGVPDLVANQTGGLRHVDRLGHIGLGVVGSKVANSASTRSAFIPAAPAGHWIRTWA